MFTENTKGLSASSMALFKALRSCCVPWLWFNSFGLGLSLIPWALAWYYVKGDGLLVLGSLWLVGFLIYGATLLLLSRNGSTGGAALSGLKFWVRYGIPGKLICVLHYAGHFFKVTKRLPTILTGKGILSIKREALRTYVITMASGFEVTVAWNFLSNQWTIQTRNELGSLVQSIGRDTLAEVLILMDYGLHARNNDHRGLNFEY